MSRDSVTTEHVVLSPRAGIALLTLQLRSASQEAVAAEGAADEVDTAAAVTELRAKIGPLVEERRRALDEELTQARAEAAANVVAAQAEAVAIVAEAMALAADATAARQAEAAAREVEATAIEAERQGAAERQAPPAVVDLPVLPPPVVEEPVTAATNGHVDHSVGHGLLVDQVIVDQASMWEPPSTLSDLASDPTTVPRAPNPDAARPVTVVLDADSFARAFAIAIAPLLEDRLRAPAYSPTQMVRVVQPAVAVKKSFWRNAWHVDVVLSGIAMVIVFAVLVAWTN